MLARNPHYFGPQAHIAGFGVELFANDDALVAAMRAGEIDAATGDPNLPPTDIRPLRTQRHADPRRAGGGLQRPDHQHQPEEDQPSRAAEPACAQGIRVRHRPARDRRHRLPGLRPGRLVDRAAGDRQVVRPVGQAAAVSTSRDANALLDPAGYKRGSGGIRIADGHPMSYTVCSPRTTAARAFATGEIMTTDFAKIGVKLTFQPTDDDALNDDITGDHYRKFDLAMWGWDTFSTRPTCSTP